jgi:hypothetical protein
VVSIRIHPTTFGNIHLEYSSNLFKSILNFETDIQDSNMQFFFFWKELTSEQSPFLLSRKWYDGRIYAQEVGLVDKRLCCFGLSLASQSWGSGGSPACDRHTLQVPLDTQPSKTCETRTSRTIQQHFEILDLNTFTVFLTEFGFGNRPLWNYRTIFEVPVISNQDLAAEFAHHEGLT